MEWSGLSERGLAEDRLSESSWLLEGSCPQGLQSHESCSVHRVPGNVEEEEWRVLYKELSK